MKCKVNTIIEIRYELSVQLQYEQYQMGKYPITNENGQMQFTFWGVIAYLIVTK